MSQTNLHEAILNITAKRLLKLKYYRKRPQETGIQTSQKYVFSCSDPEVSGRSQTGLFDDQSPEGGPCLRAKHLPQPGPIRKRRSSAKESVSV